MPSKHLEVYRLNWSFSRYAFFEGRDVNAPILSSKRIPFLWVGSMRVSVEVQMRFFVTLLFPQRVCAFLESRDQDT